MVNFEQTLRDALANATRDVMISQLRATPEMTIAELRALATGDLKHALAQVTIGDILGASTPKSATSRSRSATANRGRGGGRRKQADETPSTAPAESRPRPRQEATGTKPNTRTQDGRAAYDKLMLAALTSSGKKMAAPELGALVSGTPFQIRSSLARLIQAGAVSWTGQARGTRYEAV